jgi:hypothetical protein
MCYRSTAHIRVSSGLRVEACRPQVYLCLDRLLEDLIDRGVVILPLVIVVDEELWRGDQWGTCGMMS